jgi:hypothetical protein
VNDTKSTIAVLDNMTLDIICKSVDDVPSHATFPFQEAAVTPGGCGSNPTIGLAREGEKVYLVACTWEALDEASRAGIHLASKTIQILGAVNISL